MRRALSIVWGLVVVGGSSTGAAEPDLGFLQVRVTEGVSIEVEGVGRKVAEDDTGVTFREISNGRYFVVARREGYETQRGWVDVVRGTVAVHHTKPWQPAPTAGKGGVGSLIVQTFPLDATVDAKRLGWKKIVKGDAPFIASKVPAGTHKITFCNTYKCIDYRATIEPGRLLSIIVDFDPGAIEDVSDLHHRQLAAWRSMCRDGTDDACRRVCELDVSLHPELGSPACHALGKKPRPENVNARRELPTGD